MKHLVSLFILLLFLPGCALRPSAEGKGSLCHDGQTLRVGVDQQLLSDRDVSIPPPTDEGSLDRLSKLLTRASGCSLEVQPIISTELGRRGISEGEWDFAFLAPSLTVLALQQRQTPYTALRSLGLRNVVRSSILVPEASPITGYADMNGAKLGLLPRGSLVGFYLPLYNLYGVRLSGIVYGLSFTDLAERLAAGSIDAMAWDANQSQRPQGTRVVAVDPHLIPDGSMVMKSTLNGVDYKSMLAVLDANAFQLPTFLGYSSGSFPDPRSYHHFTKIIHDVDSWAPAHQFEKK